MAMLEVPDYSTNGMPIAVKAAKAVKTVMAEIAEMVVTVRLRS